MDRNVRLLMCFWPCGRSLSARRAWIEIGVDFAEDWLNAVALRKESVDRNLFHIFFKSFQAVALRKESVDRNSGGLKVIAFFTTVALRKESVDRNIKK